MRKLIFICFVSLSSLAYSQTFLFKEGIALPEIEVHSNKTYVVNDRYFEESNNYLSSIFGGTIPATIKETQLMIAKYDLEYLKENCPDCEGFEAIIEGAKNSKVIVKFDKNGEIVETYEKYKNVYPPMNVKSNLKLAYTHWTPVRSSYLYIYDKKDKTPRSRYVVYVEEEKGDSSKRLRFNSFDGLLEKELRSRGTVTAENREEFDF